MNQIHRPPAVILLKILEDELFEGYLGRLAKVNDLMDREVSAALLANRRNPHGTSKIMAMLEQHNSLPNGSLINRHTLVTPLIGGKLARDLDPRSGGIAFRKSWGYPKEYLCFCVFNIIKFSNLNAS